MTERLGTMLAALPDSALLALGEDRSGRLKETVVMLAQLVEAYQGLLQDSPAMQDEPQNDAEAEWQGSAEALLIQAEYVLTGQARVPVDGAVNRKNVVAMSTRLRDAVMNKATDVTALTSSVPGIVVPIGGHVLQ